MKKYYLAIDIGASSGRHILGWMEDGTLRLEEIYRFPNGVKQTDSGLVWDMEALIREVKNGICKCAQLGRLPVSVAIDTWGVDYVLLDREGARMDPVYAYRNSRTKNIPEEIEKELPLTDLYMRTGIQKQDFNTLYQLCCDRDSGRLDRAARFLMIPDYLAYCLTGRAVNEYTNATTTAMVDAREGQWDGGILERLGIPSRLFSPLCEPGTPVGNFSKSFQQEAGFNALVRVCPSHDTASAVAACPLDKSGVFISSGTWSLVGTESKVPVISAQSRRWNFTNEGGIEHRYRVLKNIMGTWLFQNIRRDLCGKRTYDEMMQLAMRSSCVRIFDVNHPSLTAPDSMIQAIESLAGLPQAGLGDILNCTYHSLASAYAETIREIESLTGNQIHQIVIVGGGSKDNYLNRLTAQYTGKPVFTGLKEATATGNILSQLMADKGIRLSTARSLVQSSFHMKEVIV